MSEESGLRRWDAAGRRFARPSHAITERAMRSDLSGV